MPPDLRGWWDRVLGVVRRSMVPLLTIQLGAAVVSAVLTYVLNLALPDQVNPDGFDGFLVLLTLLIGVAVGAVVQGASVYVAIKDAAGQPSTASEGMRFALGRAPLLIGWGLMALALIMLGFLLIVPGFYLAIVFGAALAGVVAVERAGIARCLELVNRRFWPTAGRIVPAALVGAVYSFGIAPYVVSSLSTARSISEAALQAVVGVPLSMAAVGVAVVTYAELRFHERGEVFTATLAAELSR